MYIKNPIAISQTDISGLLDSAVAAFDSSDPILQIIQLIDAAITIEPWRTEGYSLYYDSEGSLPASDSALEGMTVITAGETTGISSLYLNIGTRWDKIQEFETIPVPSIPWIVQTYAGSTEAMHWGGTDTNGSSPQLESFAFSNDTVYVNHGDLLTQAPVSQQNWRDAQTLQSTTDAYNYGGSGNIVNTANELGIPWSPPSGLITGGLKFPFATKTRIAITDSITPAPQLPNNGTTRGTGHSQKSSGVGYVAGGNGRYLPAFNYIAKVTFSSDAITNDTGTLNTAISAASSLSSVLNAYVVSGRSDPLGTGPGLSALFDVQKFPFASGTPVADPADASNKKTLAASGGNNDVGVIVGGSQDGPPSPFTSASYYTFSYSSDVSTSSFPISAVNGATGMSGQDDFYWTGGVTNTNPAQRNGQPSASYSNNTFKYPYASEVITQPGSSPEFGAYGGQGHSV
jgi:hypothetical protein